MEIDRLLTMHKTASEKDMLGMILSNRIDVMYNGKACISQSEWDLLINDLIKWKNTYIIQQRLAEIEEDK